MNYWKDATDEIENNFVYSALVEALKAWIGQSGRILRCPGQKFYVNINARIIFIIIICIELWSSLPVHMQSLLLYNNSNK